MTYRIVGSLLIMTFVVWVSAKVHYCYKFENKCGNYLAIIAKAETLESIEPELDKVIRFVEINRFDFGYTSAIITSEKDNLRPWYENLKKTHNELKKGNGSLPSPEKQKLLSKLKTTINQTPKGISSFPHNKSFAFLGYLSFSCLLFGIAIFFYPEIEEKLHKD